MRSEDKKYVWWGLLGIGVAALFYFLSSSKQSGGANTVTVPYLVPQYSTGASPTASTSLSNQPNIVGSSPNSTVPNFANPYAVATNPFEAPNTWGFMPNLQVNTPMQPNNTVSFGNFGSGFSYAFPQQGGAPMNTLPTPTTGNPMVTG